MSPVRDRHTSLLPFLTEHFSLDEFRAGQEETIRAVLGGQDALMVLPTGASKSLIYQFGLKVVV